MPRGEGPGKGNRKREPKFIDTERELSRPERRLQRCIERLSNYVKNPPKGINIEALRRYISSGDLADRDAAITDPNDAGQRNFLEQIDVQLEARAKYEYQIRTGIEILPPVDQEAEELADKKHAAAQPVRALGADFEDTFLFLVTGDSQYAEAIWLDIQHQPGAEQVMRTFIQTANELLHGDEQPRVIIDMDNFSALVKGSE